MSRIYRRLAIGLNLVAGLTLASCGEPKRIVTNLAPPAERLVCEAAGNRPTIPPEYTVNWNVALSARTVPQAVALAQNEHGKYVASIRSREGAIAAYIISVEGKLFVCSNNAAWLREWYKNTAAPSG